MEPAAGATIWRHFWAVRRVLAPHLESYFAWLWPLTVQKCLAWRLLMHYTVPARARAMAETEIESPCSDLALIVWMLLLQHRGRDRELKEVILAM